ncbi:MAG: tRNA pseudouridine(38-40) synthase TruA [Acidobacteriota bacterium]
MKDSSAAAGPRYRARVAYVGTGFRGFQLQHNAARTVQSVLEEALAIFAAAPVRVHAAGRTDAGVHADGQVIHFDLPSAREPLRVREGVNALLPWDVRILDVGVAPEGFLARRDADWKEYLYRWSRAPVIPPRESPFVAPIASRALAAPMSHAARDLAGRKDFGAFAVRVSRDAGGVRRVHFAGVEESGDEIRLRIRGDAFLRGMVRSICGVLAHVGRGRAPETRIAEILATGDRGLLAPKAPACGLSLVLVHYPGDPEPGVGSSEA